MPRSLRKAVSIALLVFFGLVSHNCVAQTTATATAAVYVVVVRGISVTASSELDFGRLRQATGTSELPPAGPNVASFTVSGQPKSGVSFTFPKVVTLQSPEGRSLAFTPDVPIWNRENSQSHNRQLFPSVTGGRVSLSSKGLIYVWFGGSVNTDSVSVGSYSGQYTVTITY